MLIVQHRNAGHVFGPLRASTVVWLMLVAFARGEDAVDYAKHIKPVLQARCYACHGALKQESKLRLDTAAFVIQGGDGGAVIRPGDVDGSAIIQRVTSDDPAERMPPEGEPLRPAEIAALKTWIAQGAKAPADEQSERDPRDHWAFRTPNRPQVPTVADAAWVRNPIDAFIAAEHQQRGLRHQPAADKRVWLRRVSLDLIGLPPTREELEAFVVDDSADAYDTVVTRLLDSPHYGERWGRHWMDIWRYSDWWGLGAEVRNSQKHIWHWRDWIIESLNADTGYDQMLREMLAADELYPNDLGRLRASGFLARQYFKFNRTSWLDETIEHTSKAMLGLTLNCSKCHDHKYDPMSQADYYRLRAIFEPYQVRTDLVPGEIDFEKNGIPRAFDCNLEAATFVHVRGDDRNPDKNRVIEPAVPAFLSLGDWKVEPVPLPAEAYQPGLRPFVVEGHVRFAEQRIVEARAALDAARKKLDEAKQAAKLEATKPVDEKPAEAASSSTPKAILRDDFSAARPDAWEMHSGSWSYTDGKLIQSQIGATRAVLRLKQLPPADFEAKLKYAPTGGEMWKSVGLSFDVIEPNEVLAYLSSYSGGPKSQIAYKAGGSYAYPPGAAQARPIDLNKPHELTLRVRGTLVNVAVDGEHSIAYRLPIQRQPGHLEVITFDAKAEFLSFELNALTANVVLAEAEPAAVKPADGPLPMDQAELGVVISEKALGAAAAHFESIKARAAADHARNAEISSKRLSKKWEGAAHAEPGTAEKHGSAGASPSRNPASRIASKESSNDQAAPAATPTSDRDKGQEPGATSELIRAAAKAERIAAAAKADEDASRAELDVLRATAAKRGDAEKKLAAAKTTLEAARQSLDMPGEKYTPLPGSLKTLESNLENEESRQKPFPQASTGRRSALANWLTDPRHPLPARVAVNHMWSRHFGRPLVPTVFDFGRKGTPPTHPALLDWLAVEFIENHWSMKHIHRLIVTSHTYRLTSSAAGAADATLAADPENRFYWRANPIRMEAQLVRDSLLSLAGELDLTRGGPPIPANNEASRRRSLYFVHSHNEHHKFLSMFDDASVLECYRRAESIVPQQALALENSPLATAMAEKISECLAAANPNASHLDFIRAAFLTVLSVEPNEAEQTVALDALARWTDVGHHKNRPNAEARARTTLIHALVNHNDFVTIR